MNEDRENLQQVAGESEADIEDQMPGETSSNHINDDDDIERRVTTVDEVFEKTGPCGRYQCMQVFAICILGIPMAFQMFIMYFTGHSPNWRCVNATNSACNITGEISPADVDQFHSRCHMPRDSWEYVTPRQFSFITEFDLICDKNPVGAFANSIMYIAWGLGSIPLGVAADRYGRKPVLLMSYTIIISAQLASSFVTAVWQFLLLRAIVGLFSNGYGMSSYVLGSEIVGTKFRSVFGNTLHGMVSAGVLLLSAQAYFIQEWRKLSIICSAPYFASAILFLFINESPRWLNSQGHVEKSAKIMRKISMVNKKKHSLQPNAQVCDTKKAHGSFIHLFQPARQLLKTISLSFGWLVVAMTFYGVSLAAANLSGNMYRDFTLVNLIEFPAIPLSILLLEKLGRRTTTGVAMIGAGLFCCSITLFPQKSEHQLYPKIRVGLGMAAKLCSVLAFEALYVWTGELYPTIIRTQALSFASVAARIGASLAPFLTETFSLTYPSLPFITMGVLSILSGSWNFLLPETAGKSMKDSVDLKEPREYNGNPKTTCHMNDDCAKEGTSDAKEGISDAKEGTSDADPHRNYEEEALLEPGRSISPQKRNASMFSC